MRIKPNPLGAPLKTARDTVCKDKGTRERLKDKG